MSKRILVEGLVQGVGYRYAFSEQARRLGLRGWVRNRRDGSVEACVDGDAASVDAIVRWAQSGPPAARVSKVSVSDDATLAYSSGGFEIRPTE
ncbi:acylphosphatase [Massilia sp. BJB1822]|uniref:acylphosphatase n=1 Tax=Massilia sp. BJB1822 TaxID=2744470 RepID=UPI0015931A47|nr:acylphosphatase [Massilia sp. BJB1822]NVD98013.1 acylphosphatase [Massilia sp. BJB1822]